MTNGHKAGWLRLQKVSIYHATKLYTETRHPQRVRTVRGNPRYVYVPDVIKENVEILGHGTEEDVKARLMWYVEFYPNIYNDSGRA